ncbi:thioredoxin family protein [Ulvibacterium sp.]|uniref:DUF1223 domain-containing protein n=1 Tax=Ulvibacterium sp. TaxID=2665914 RepID=UPI0026332C22|nr:DUF1223 domain-containing protein [Ulvibacterium sp.]
MLKKILATILVLGSLVFVAFTNTNSLENDYSDKTNSAIATFEPIVVLELFTSQGCSSCPPADALLNKVKNEFTNEVFALSYHVDYWNYIGWEDPFSKPDYAKKQKEYNIQFRNRSNYTPQMVINGKEHFVGSNASLLYSKIDQYKERKVENGVKLSKIDRDGQNVSFEYDIEGDLGNKELRLLLVLDQRRTEVPRGENRNRTLTNSNIVVAEKKIALTDSKGRLALSIPKIVEPNEKKYVIALVQDSSYGITGAAKNAIR